MRLLRQIVRQCHDRGQTKRSTIRDKTTAVLDRAAAETSPKTTKDDGGQEREAQRTKRGLLRGFFAFLSMCSKPIVSRLCYRGVVQCRVFARFMQCSVYAGKASLPLKWL
eukprot:TRINITY_DN9625_c0_g2_i1.p1 TRINITY_DN9625_c0_g2~~TRINITY_DN9625_c0_g2_i1.p1  ORF type:complete len:110 (-),score=1.98 TRINITY_DN9625_c0_g2_i1:133-462(-)